MIIPTALEALVLLMIATAEALVLQLPEDHNLTEIWDSSIPLTAQATTRLVSQNLSASRYSLDEWDSSCDRALYGRNLNIDSCLQAFSVISFSMRQEMYPNRADPSLVTTAFHS